MKKIILLIIAFVIMMYCVKAQNVGSITVGGDFSKFYPTLWIDGGWNNNVASQLEIGRSNVHENGDWRGTLMAKFKYHTIQWGNGANFIDADIIQNHNALVSSGIQNVEFIAGWTDASTANTSASIIIWLRGGGTTYHYKSLFPVSCTVFDGIANPLPYQEANGPAHTYKTATDLYVNSNGLSKGGAAYFNGSTTNYFAGNLGIGTTDTKGYKFAVAGNMIAESVKVKLQNAWPDYVFTRYYSLPSLQETEQYIKENGHLPGIPSANEITANGINLGEMNVKLLQKIEELTLYLIEQNEKLNKLDKRNEEQQKEINDLKSKLK